jgi:hypothetical protein
VGSKSLEGLSAQSQGFLIASLLFRSKDYGSLFSFLDNRDLESLSERAKTLLQLERTNRVRLLVTELRRLIHMSAQPWILAVHPSWLSQILQGESECIRQLALASLPGVLFEPNKQVNFPQTLLSTVRRAIEMQLVPMRTVTFDLEFVPEQLLVLTRDELERVVAAAGLQSVASFLANEPKSVQREVAQRLDYGKGMRLLEHCHSPKDSDAELFSCIVKLSIEGKIDERFAKCLKPK